MNEKHILLQSCNLKRENKIAGHPFTSHLLYHLFNYIQGLHLSWQLLFLFYYLCSRCFFFSICVLPLLHSLVFACICSSLASQRGKFSFIYIYGVPMMSMRLNICIWEDMFQDEKKLTISQGSKGQIQLLLYPPRIRWIFWCGFVCVY